ncbi:hypothetical protein BN946_scf184747.g43, partial [Trametes cinnabarina]
KRKLSATYDSQRWGSDAGAASSAPYSTSTHAPNLIEHTAKHRRTASGSDFSTYDIKHALDMPAAAFAGPSVPPPLPQPQLQPQPPPDRASHQERLVEHVPSLELPELLDVSHLDSMDAISARFEQIASELLHNYYIEIARDGRAGQLEILELEFYLYMTGTHEDPFTHASPEQAQSGKPPRRNNDPTAAAASPSGFRGGTRKGLDLTFGKPLGVRASKYFPQPQGGTPEGLSSEKTSVLRGGILLRSIRRVSDGKVISGPSLLVDEILRASGASEILELIAVNWDGDITAFPPTPVPTYRLSSMWLRRRDGLQTADTNVASQDRKPDKPRIFRSPRIGLDISHPSITPASAGTHPRVTFVARPYRFFVSPHLLTANGRGQTFLGVYDALQAAGYCESDGELVEELARLTGVKGPTAAKYLAALRVGLRANSAGNALGVWIGPNGKTVLSSVTAWLEMTGTLRRLGIATAPG